MDETGGAIAGLISAVVWLGIIVLYVAGLWKVFEKAGKPGWAAIVPIYNIIVMLEICEKPIWWVVLFLIPFVNFVVLILLFAAIASAFGKGTGFTVGLILLPVIFFPILGFGDAKYQGAPAKA